MTEPVISRKIYGLAWLGLLGLTALTTAVAFADLGVFNTVAAVVIAGIKALLIAFIFMHLTKSVALTRVIAVGALIWLLIMMTLTFTDYVTRGWLPVPGK